MVYLGPKSFCYQFTGHFSWVSSDDLGGLDGKVSTMWETRVQSLAGEDLLEKEMATHSSILA